MWNLKNRTNEPVDKTETDSQTEHKSIVTKGEQEINRNALLYIKQTTRIYGTAQITIFNILYYNISG